MYDIIHMIAIYSNDMNISPLFPLSALTALHTPGVSERWAAVQEHLHPPLAQLAERVQAVAAHRLPHLWPLYEVSFKSQRYIHRGHRERLPIEEYHVAFDRPPRGSGIMISVNGAERSVLVGIQLWGVRKNHLRQLWEASRHIWLPLVERIEHSGQARFASTDRRQRGAQRARQHTESDHTTDETPAPCFWIDRYLQARNASYLWAGWVYPWDNLPDNLADHLVDLVLDLLPFNESLMEQAEAPASLPPMLLHEQQTRYAVLSGPPAIETIVEHIHTQGFAISDTTIRSYHVALQTRPLVILAGISGTGKTRLTRLYADAVHAIPSSAHDNPYYLLVAVQPDWHNARDLVGYYNALTNLYHPTPFLRFLLRAASDPQQRYFVCLDEMNLARPEYYLAPLLSALETSEHTIDLGTPSEEVSTTMGERLRTPFRLPLNVSITGTVNVDETTHTLSDKLLDRANLIELTEVDLSAFRAIYQGHIDEAAWETLSHIHAIVAQAGHPFGYRTISEMLAYIEQAQGVLPTQQALDLQVKQKVLPRLRGEESQGLRHALNQLLTLLRTVPLPESASKVQRMLEHLTSEGFTDFYS